MSDDKPKPVDDLKEGLGLLFRAAKGAVEKLPTDKLEDVAKDAVKEVGRAFESLGNEIDKALGRPPAKQPSQPPPEATKDEPKHDDGYAPEPPKGPRVS
jgi:hypothetical protein